MLTAKALDWAPLPTLCPHVHNAPAGNLTRVKAQCSRSLSVSVGVPTGNTLYARSLSVHAEWHLALLTTTTIPVAPALHLSSSAPLTCPAGICKVVRSLSVRRSWSRRVAES